MDEPELLDIKQAAALLQVSETSLRRWTKAGLLSSFRVGGRRERRFRRVDLLAFLEACPAKDASKESSDRNAALGHLCGFYQTDEGRTRQAAQFLYEGLRADHACFLSATPDVRDRILAALDQHRPRWRRTGNSGNLVQLEYGSVAADQLKYWDTALRAAVGGGKRLMRVIGEVSGGRLYQSASFEEVLEYEAAYERLIARRFPVATLCLYDARSLSGVQTALLFREHPDVFRYPVERLTD